MIALYLFLEAKELRKFGGGYYRGYMTDVN
jgi:hypothetical protein